MKTLNDLMLRLSLKLSEERGDASSDTMILIIIGVALAIVVVGVLTTSFGDIAATVAKKLQSMITGT